ncbi:MAG: DNA mismatch repair protein MutS, partial [Planctomycetota bacterium]
MTPVMQQYKKIKDKHEKDILFFRMGDFYEMFYEDAKVASKVLGIALTSRDKGSDAVPMAGFPHHSAETYIRRLLQAGYNVAICEQVEDPKVATGIVDRAVTQIITPGTFTDDKFLNAKKNNYVTSLFVNEKTVGIATADISTGEFFVTETMLQQVASEVSRLFPAEVLFPESLEQTHSRLVANVKSSIITVWQPRPDWEFGKSAAYKTLTGYFHTTNLVGFGCEEMDSGICAAGALLSYLLETQCSNLPYISSIKPMLHES